MSDSPVLQLQQLSQSGDTAISELLRRALVLAVKLNITEAQAWINHELDGYPPGADVPSYRVVPSELQLQNPYHGWAPVAWGDSNEVQEHFARATIRSPVSEIADVLQQRADQLTGSITQEEMNVLLTLSPNFARLKSARFYSRGSFVAILEAVRKKILDWALALEKQGVLGEGMRFEDAEKQGAAAVPFRATEAKTMLLFLSANPNRRSPLAVEQEQKRVVKVRNGSQHQALVRIEGLPDLDLPEFAKSLRLHAPTIVHFSGHGGPDGSLLMRDEKGKAKAMRPEGVAKLVALQKSTIRLAVLNACYSDALAEQLVGDIDCVVGMTDSVSDDAAILFSQSFYGALFDGQSVADAFTAASATVEATYEDDAGVPALRTKTGINAAELHLVG